ncbi:MAG: glycosyltransferase family 2 protein [Chitinophagaceae bacterium]|nr:glycosyltransferase family 2 protein [Chitinophagaceae bacterium]
MPVRKTPRHTKSSSLCSPITKLSIIIPCYNEASTIALILDKINDAVLPHSIEKEIIVVNDCSTDDTNLMISEYIEDNPSVNIIYKLHPKNAGKGAAIQTGLSAASGEYVLIQDADLEYDPKEYALLLEPVCAGHADIVYGSRFMGGQPHRILFFWHTIGNKMLTFVSNLFTNMNLTDAHTCYKLVPLKIIRNIPLLEKRFAFDAELNVKLSSIPGIRIYEVGISYYGRTFSEGKKIRMRDAFRTVWCLIKYTISFRSEIPQQSLKMQTRNI